MGLAVSSAHAATGKNASSELNSQDLIEIYRLMYLSRRIDDREILLKRQQKTFFQVSGAGHEAFQVGAALALKPGYDWFFPYYRDRGLCLALGVTPTEMFLQAVGARKRPSQRRTADADALEQRSAAHCEHIVIDGDAGSACGGLR